MIKVKLNNSLDWILQNIDKHVSEDKWKGNFVSHLLPDRFETYVKILHTIYEDESIVDKEITWNSTEQDNIKGIVDDPIKALLSDSTVTFMSIDNNFQGNRIKWVDLSLRYEVPYEKTINIYSFINRLPGNSLPRYLVGPNEGSLVLHEIEELIRILLPSSSDKECYYYFNQLVFGDLENEYFYKGRLSELIDLYNSKDFPFANSPTYFWPESKDWCVNTDYDLCFSIIGCDNEIAESLLASNILETIEIDRHTRIDYKVDEK